MALNSGSRSDRIGNRHTEGIDAFVTKQAREPGLKQANHSKDQNRSVGQRRQRREQDGEAPEKNNIDQEIAITAVAGFE
jgi:hypothetical protein